ncbi:toxin-activating lysine-acyltransferase [Oricola sp.]|uniref:toxin-activating lysine-acyltransferase n=1 Tax=Oricola sp. TaxID=1979950 RepID=UPI003BA8768A
MNTTPNAAPELDESPEAKTIRQSLGPVIRTAAFGEILSVLMQSPRYRGVTLGSLAQILVPPLLTRQFVVARLRPEEGKDDTQGAPVASAFWARVSDEIDKRLTEDETNPPRLQAPEWHSGEHIWVIDLVGPNNLGPAVINSVRQRVGADKTIKMRVEDAAGQSRVQILAHGTAVAEQTAPV